MTSQIVFYAGKPEDIIGLSRTLAEIARLHGVQVKAIAGYDWERNNARPLCIHFDVSGTDESVQAFHIHVERKHQGLLFPTCPKQVHAEPNLEAGYLATLNDDIEYS